ncbi:hypothetical protein TPB0596_19320 [Tsukamurella pulmonis]|uniref:Uncharacterized protein n=1 Tax=Tsukamurella pulmonis TaxID=47312 RepID=A0A1H1FTQ2_9ACTN|nr:hypothetical protein [Tsukamurella pulmonis]BDD82169.1 hypothetical protein TPB0596_19320 [Tsukamurella pulmonis]SDR04265.1 hypothetical protein SAMN04489765_2911 [Tsukamurella pulmonis]SUP18438.1 Uncharacterised protein [Tsukamurella pulmonis]
MRTLATIVATAAISFAGSGLALAADEPDAPTATSESADSPREVGATAEGASDPRSDPEYSPSDEILVVGPVGSEE